jgi:hypothetical protein
MDFRLVYKITPDVQPLEIFIHSDWGGDKETARSTAGGIIFLYGNPVTWFCQKQGDVSLLRAKQSTQHKPMLLKEECISYFSYKVR